MTVLGLGREPLEQRALEQRALAQSVFRYSMTAF